MLTRDQDAAADPNMQFLASQGITLTNYFGSMSFNKKSRGNVTDILT